MTVNNQSVTRQGASAAHPETVVVGVAPGAGSNGVDVITAVTGRVFVAQTPEAFTYDADGNLLTDGRFTYARDGENRLVGVQTVTNLPAAVPRLKLAFAYDYMGRRVKKTVSVWTNSAWSAFSTNLFLYDDWSLISEYSQTPASAGYQTNHFFWGLDLSGSLQGAGGIGGLFCTTYGSNLPMGQRFYSAILARWISRDPI
jgi:hypothetical protein